MKNVKKENFFEKLQRQGQSITFDDNGIPLIQNQPRTEATDFVDFEIQKEKIYKTKEVNEPRVMLDSQDGGGGRPKYQ